MSKILLRLIDFYQKYLSFDSGMLAVFAPGGACKYPVTCSEYTKIMVLEKGWVKGLFLGLKRILSCR